MECSVEFDYDAQEEDELTMKKGDIITNVVRKMDGWWEGTLKGKTGMFPDNFVKVLEKSTSSITSAPSDAVQKPGPKTNVILRNNSNKSTRRLKALFSYSPEQDDELRLEIGDVIEYISEVEEGWWRGKLNGKIGIFPSNFVSDAQQSTAVNGRVDAETKLNDLSKQSTTIGKVPDVVPPAPPTSEPPPMDEDDEPPPVLPPKPVREQARCFYPYQAMNEDELTLTEGDIVSIISKNCDDEGWWRGELRGKTGLFPDNFVKIISPMDAYSSPKLPGNSGVPQGPKISPQERNLAGVKPVNVGGLQRSGSSVDENKVNGMNDLVDGSGGSKVKTGEENGRESVSSKVHRFSQLNFIPGMKPATPTSPSSGSSPLSLPAAINSRNASKDEEEGDFNSVERGEKLSHLTAGRAKAPRRRPPSGIGKDGEENGLNGSYSNDVIESSPQGHSTPLNLSLNSQTTQSNSMLETSNISENGNTDSPSTGQSSKLKKVPPWMAELKQKQDKKQSPNSSALSNTSVTSPVTSPSHPPVSASPNQWQPAEKESVPPPTLPTKAPPLPAKPSTLATNASPSVDKVSPSGTAPAPFNRSLGKKAPAPSVILGSNHSNEIGNAAGGDSQAFVSYDEYAKLRDRVIILETELETVRRQLKLLLDRELNQGHIV